MRLALDAKGVAIYKVPFNILNFLLSYQRRWYPVTFIEKIKGTILQPSLE